MSQAVTLKLPARLVEKAEAYAATHGTTTAALVRSHLESLIDRDAETLRAYSEGRLGRAEAIRLLGLRDAAALLVALGDNDLPIPRPSPEEIERQASTFETLWQQA